jgi:hypothetical protein
MVSISQQPLADPYPAPVQLLAGPRSYLSADPPRETPQHARTTPEPAPYVLTEAGIGFPVVGDEQRDA